jgi:hypothetical protein
LLRLRRSHTGRTQTRLAISTAGMDQMRRATSGERQKRQGHHAPEPACLDCGGAIEDDRGLSRGRRVREAWRGIDNLAVALQRGSFLRRGTQEQNRGQAFLIHDD